MKKIQIGLRLLLLGMALLAALFAWIGAVRSRQRAESAIERLNLEARLQSEERWRDTLRAELQGAPSPSLVRSVTNSLPAVERRIAALRGELETIQP